MQVQHIVQQLLQVVCPSMHRVRRASLAASVLGALRGRRLTVTAIGRALPGGTSQKHAIKRADRLLSNRHLHGQRVKHYQGLCRPLIGARTRPVLLVDWSDLDARKRHYLLRASVAVNGRSATVYEEVHTLAGKDKRRTHRAFLRQLQAVLPVGCRPIIVTDAGFRTPWFQQVEALGWDWVGRIRNRHKMRWCSGGRWFDANRCYQQASSMANYLGQAVLTRSNPLVCQLVVYRGKAQGRKHYTYAGNVAQGRRSRVCAAREREPWLLATSLPVTRTLARQVVRLYRLRMSIEEGFRDMKSHQFGLGLTYHRCASVERLQVLVFIASLALLVLWLVGTATIAQGAHYQFQAVNAKVKFPTCAKVKFPSLWVVASHCDLLNFTPLRMLSVWFQPAEVAEVITLERLFMLHELHAQGASISAIAQQTGLDRKTVRRHLAAGIQPPTYGPRASRGSLIDAYTEYLQARIAHYPGLSAQRLLREIQAQGYTGGYATLTAYLHTIRPPKESGYEVRFETPAGHQAQVDFAHFKVRFRYDPQVVRVVWLFSLVLGHSRYLFGRFVWRQTLDVVVAAHAAAFTELGGVPAQILYDRMKTVVLGEPEPGEIIYHPTLLALAAHYGFRPKACRPYRAKTKGKVERPFRYVRQDFFLAGQFDDLNDLNRQFDSWRTGIANQRTHATTGQVVQTAFDAERPALQPLPAGPFNDVLSLERRVSHDGMVSVDGNLYSVPDTTRKRQVEVQRSATEIRIIEQGQCVACHPLLTGRGQRHLAPGHRPPRKTAPASPAPPIPGILTRPGEIVATRDLSVYQRIGQAKARETLA